jgi:DNA repair protein RadC
MNDDQIIDQALQILEERMKYKAGGKAFTSPETAKKFCQLKLGERENEVFAVLFLTNKHRLIAFEEMFQGTINQTSVWPREVVKTALQHNAAAVIFCHNHPSGEPEPSGADRQMTERLRIALEVVDVKTLDHLVVGHEVYSFAEHGLI